MKLAAYMRQHDLDDEAFARLVSADCSGWAVRKWRYDQRVPRAAMLRRIAEITSGAVTANDFLDVAAPASPAHAVA